MKRRRYWTRCEALRAQSAYAAAEMEALKKKQCQEREEIDEIIRTILAMGKSKEKGVQKYERGKESM